MRRHSIASVNPELSHRMVHLSQHHLNQLDKALKEVGLHATPANPPSLLLAMSPGCGMRYFSTEAVMCGHVAAR